MARPLLTLISLARARRTAGGVHASLSPPLTGPQPPACQSPDFRALKDPEPTEALETQLTPLGHPVQRVRGDSGKLRSLWCSGYVRHEACVANL